MTPMTLFHEIGKASFTMLHLTGVVRGALGEKLPQVCLSRVESCYFLMQRGCSMMFNEGVWRRAVSLWELRWLPSFSEVLRVFFPAIDHPANKCPYEFFLLNSKTCKSVQIHHDIGQGKVRKVPQRANLTISAFIGFIWVHWPHPQPSTRINPLHSSSASPIFTPDLRRQLTSRSHSWGGCLAGSSEVRSSDVFCLWKRKGCALMG